VSRARRTAAVLASAARQWAAARWRAPRLAPEDRRRLAATLARRTLHALEVEVVRCGVAPAAGPLLLVANHVSWLDVYALNALWEGRFVAKSETRRWPIAGAVAAGFDTFFIVRGSFRDAARTKTAVAAALGAGQSVAVFPEGTTTDGTRLGRFHPALFQAAVDAGAAVQPVAIRYPDADGRPNPDAAFVGDTTFAASLARVLAAPRIRVELTFGSPLDASGRTRRELAALAHAFVAETLGLPPAVVAPVRAPARAPRSPRRPLAAGRRPLPAGA
jgi:1-acyl-sn-glycerol-3-phosphate acyltransferase